jgi:hypothetical protein
VEASRDNAERLALVLPGLDVLFTPTHWSFGQLASLVGTPATICVCSRCPSPASIFHMA